MKVQTESHLHGETIVEHAFPTEYDELLEAVAGLKPVLRKAEPFTPTGRPPTPKRHKRQIRGQRKFALLPVDQNGMNVELEDKLRPFGWERQPFASAAATGRLDTALKGDFAKNRVFVEVEFGNSASMYRDLFKFQIASRSHVGEVAALIVATDRLARFFDSGITTFEQVHSLLPYMAIGIQMPIWIVGIEPESFDDVRLRYNEMKVVAESNGLPCHSYEDVMGLAPEVPAIEDPPIP